MTVGSQRSGDDSKTVVVGSDAAAILAARRLSGSVLFLGREEQLVRRADDEVASTTVVDDDIVGQIDDADAAIVATTADSTNLLVAQRLCVDTDVSDVVVRVTDPTHREALSDIDAEPVCTAGDVAETLVERYARVVA